MSTPSLWRTVLHLYAFAQLGVLTRLVIGRLFSGPCSGTGRWRWAPCVTGSGLMLSGGTLFYDFPSNVLGSFIIGFISSGSTLTSTFPHLQLHGDAVASQLLFLPPSSMLQGHGALHLGFRTGYCGSLTTFSSWMLQVVVLMVGRSSPPGTLQGTQWVQALVALFLGTSGPLLALVMGQHLALAASTSLYNNTARKKSRQQSAAGRGKPVAIASEQAVVEVAEVRNRASHNEPAAAPPPPEVLVLQAESAAASKRHTGITTAAAACLIADGVATAIALTLTGVSIAYLYLDRPIRDDHMDTADVSSVVDTDGVSGERRHWWFAILLGPPGAVLRWYLSRFNSTPGTWRCRGGSDSAHGGRCLWFRCCCCCGGHGGVDDCESDDASGTCTGGGSGCGGWGWLQLGTFAANTLACVLNFVCVAVLFRGRLGFSQRQVLQGLMIGTAGCLSTVSTWVVELQRLSLISPAGAYKYFAASVTLPVVLGLLLYGIPAWTAP